MFLIASNFFQVIKFASSSLQQRIINLTHAQRKSRAVCCRGFSRGVNKPTTRQTSHANDFEKAKSHAREKPLLAGHRLPGKN